jgi:hypothetical protein
MSIILCLIGKRIEMRPVTTVKLFKKDKMFVLAFVVLRPHQRQKGQLFI